MRFLKTRLPWLLLELTRWMESQHNLHMEAGDNAVLKIWKLLYPSYGIIRVLTCLHPLKISVREFQIQIRWTCFHLPSSAYGSLIQPAQRTRPRVHVTIFFYD
ncbi:hypothetical protein HanPSC8_Chr06g0231681 [Helianthus annuus]|nr:hypothetical protein HanPSC8_Chr06g0231681 [Helianthus annuus]